MEVRFRIGPKPYATDFDPTGWIEVPAPRHNLLVALAAAMMALLLCGLLLLLNYLLLPGGLRFEGYRLWQLFAIFLFTIPSHELVHALLQPGLGRQTTFGFWPGRLVFYAFHPGPRTRTQTLIGAIGPFFALSIAPPLVAAALSSTWWGVMALSLINGGASTNDLLAFFFVLARVPAGAEVMGQRRKGYWRLPVDAPQRTST